MSLPIKQKYMTLNQCYKNATKITVKGVVVHSTAAKEGESANTEHYYIRWNNSSVEKCVHAFLDETDVTETLPCLKGNCYKAWHCGGTYNSSHIGFEIIEPRDYADKEYFEKVKENAIEYVAILFIRHGLTEVTKETCCCHAEAHAMGKASNHADIDHWWKKYHGYTMDEFRSDVKAKIKQLSTSTSSGTASASKNTISLKITSNTKSCQIWLNTNYNISPKLAVDNKYGKLTRNGFITAIKKELKKLGIAIDVNTVKVATKTYAGLVKYASLKKGSRGIFVTILQALLVCNGYNPNGIDGIYGTGCVNAVTAYQKAKNLKQTGTVTEETWKALLS